MFETEHYDRFSDGKAVAEESNGAANGFDPHTLGPWWEDAKRRHTDAEVRTFATCDDQLSTPAGNLSVKANATSRPSSLGCSNVLSAGCNLLHVL